MSSTDVMGKLERLGHSVEEKYNKIEELKKQGDQLESDLRHLEEKRRKKITLPHHRIKLASLQFDIGKKSDIYHLRQIIF